MKKIINFIAVVTILAISFLSLAMDVDTQSNSKKRKLSSDAPQSGAKKSKKQIFECDRPECGKIFTRKNNLAVHVQLMHEKSAENTESKKTTSKKLFQCKVPECGSTFTQKSGLTRHMKIHTGKKPFKCTECDKAFIERSNLTTHMQVHTKERPSFKCLEPGCKKTFTLKGNLTRHINLVHKKQTETGAELSDPPTHQQAIVIAALTQDSALSSSDKSSLQSSSTPVDATQSSDIASLPDVPEAVVPMRELGLLYQDDWLKT